MNKPFVIAHKEMQERVTNAVNISINNVPATIIADFLEKLVINLRTIAESQYDEAERQFKESIKKKKKQLNSN